MGTLRYSLTFCVPKLVWDFPSLYGIDTSIKFLSSYLSTWSFYATETGVQCRPEEPLGSKTDFALLTWLKASPRFLVKNAYSTKFSERNLYIDDKIKVAPFETPSITCSISPSIPFFK